MKNFLNDIIRFLNSFRRPSKAENLKKLKNGGETLDSFTFRDAVAEDVPALGKLHAITWAETYHAKVSNIALRQSQWQQAFSIANDGSWFCLIVVNSNKELVGFLKGIIHRDEGNGEINKIYLLRNYQRLGLGKQMFRMAVQRFTDAGVNKMYLLGVPQNPSCYFHEAMGGEKMHSEKGNFDGGYRWKDLSRLLAR